MGQVKRMLEEAQNEESAKENFAETLEMFDSQLDDTPLFSRPSEIDEFFAGAHALIAVMTKMVERAESFAHEEYQK